MTSFGYRSNPCYAIKECSSCGTLYTRDCVCSIGTVEDKILVSKPPKNCARCTRCGYLVDGLNYQGCALLRRELKENLESHSPDVHNTFKPSNASTNVVNAPREPYVVKQDNRNVLRDGEACKRCTCKKCGSGFGKGLCYICGHNQNSLNDSLSIFETSSQSPSNINHCCYECGDPLDGIFCKRCTYQFEDFSESNEEFSSTDDDSFSINNIDYVEASPPDSELVIPESCFDEDVREKIVSKPLCEEEIIPMESLRTHDSSLLISSKIDSILDEFVGELTLLKSIPPGIDETDCDFEKDICLIEKLLYDNSSPRPPKEFIFANSDAASESFSPSHILVKDSDFLMKEIDLFYTLNYPMPPGIVDKDYDSERDILIRKDLPRNNTLSFAEQESFHFDIPPFSRPPAKPPDGDTRILNIKMMGDISDQKAFMHKLMITLAPHQEKSPDLLSHRCGTVKKFNTHRIHLNNCPMLIHGQNNPPLDVLLFHFYPP
nr:hypothetical protein [Tanacetum cinerariifolium]